MGDDKSKKQTEQAAFTDAKRKAAEFTMSYMKSETRIKSGELEKDLVQALANAQIRIIQEIEKVWYKDASSGDCLRVKIKAEVIPDEKALKSIEDEAANSPNAPLKVTAWTSKPDYKQGEKIKVYIKGNKPFYARVLNKDAAGEIIQLLPNPYRLDNYFNGGVVYEIPTGHDRFELEVNPPFGEETILVYASTSQLGAINIEANGGVYQVKTKPEDIGERTRAITPVSKKENGAKQAGIDEFYEGNVTVKTGE